MGLLVVCQQFRDENVLFTFIYIVNRVVSGEIYTAGKNFTLPPAVTAWTNSTSVHCLRAMGAMTLLGRQEEE